MAGLQGVASEIEGGAGDIEKLADNVDGNQNNNKRRDSVGSELNRVTIAKGFVGAATDNVDKKAGEDAIEKILIAAAFATVPEVVTPSEKEQA